MEILSPQAVRDMDYVEDKTITGYIQEIRMCIWLVYSTLQYILLLGIKIAT